MRVSWRVVVVLPSVRVGVVVPSLAEVFVMVVPASMLERMSADLLLVSQLVFMGRVSFSVLVCGFIVARWCVCCLRAWGLE